MEEGQEAQKKYPLNLTQESRHYSYGSPEVRELILRVIQPSEPHGVWVGNEGTLRQWRKLGRHPASVSYLECTEEDIREFERALGEVDIKSLRFSTHSGLGLVVEGHKKEK